MRLEIILWTLYMLFGAKKYLKLNSWGIDRVLHILYEQIPPSRVRTTYILLTTDL